MAMTVKAHYLVQIVLLGMDLRFCIANAAPQEQMRWEAFII
jgi:hypothetical protein